MIKKIKLVLSSLLIIAMAATTVCFADTNEVYLSEDGIAPAYVAVNSVIASLSFSGKLAYPVVTVNANPYAADKVVMTIKLNKVSNGIGSTVKTWRDKSISVSTSGRASFADSYAVITNGTYQVSVSGKVYKNGVVVDNFTQTSKLVSCS